ncbi:DUF397 domain-containing protein [Spirillospora sp. NPDC047279]|uniref:DUF397 domain-containing protein n=1 Tax=Spirillospora sp. NPDC047279 TaxID=3155478 RepID=UPI003404D924
MSERDLSRAVWRKSVHSDGGQGCVEVAHVPGLVGVRDSKDPLGPHLAFAPAAWARAARRIARGDYDL